MAKPFRLAVALPLLLICAPAIATDTGSSSNGSDSTGVGSDREPVGGSQGTSGDSLGTKEHDRNGNAIPDRTATRTGRAPGAAAPVRAV